MQDRAGPASVTRQSPVPSIVIRTLPLAEGNYGGVLQAYALQEYLRRLGVDSITDSPTAFRLTGRTMARGGLSILRGRGDKFLPPGIRNAINSRIHDFVVARIRTVDTLETEGLRRRDVLDAVSVAITGSDQVWRRAYGGVLPYLFDDLSPTDTRLLSFAASFGRDDLQEHSPRLIRQSGDLVRRFHAVSVRERSGIDLCKKYWGVSAEHHLDPVFLFDGDHYRELVERAVHRPAEPSNRSVFAYVLDDSREKSMFVAETAARIGAPQASIRMPKLPRRSAYRADPGFYLRPSVEEWIQGFLAADFVITDSFHGTALSILLNRPFISLVNHGRGAARFISLLEVFGLQERLWRTPSEPLPRDLLGPVDWEIPNRIAHQERKRAGDYLARNLLGATPAHSRGDRPAREFQA